MKSPLHSSRMVETDVNPWPLLRPALSKDNLDSRPERDFRYGLSYGTRRGAHGYLNIFRENDGSYTLTNQGGEVAVITPDNELRLLTPEISEYRTTAQGTAERWKSLVPLWFSTARRQTATGDVRRSIRYGVRNWGKVPSNDFAVVVHPDRKNQIVVRDGAILRGTMVSGSGAEQRLRLWLEPDNITPAPEYQRDDALYADFNQYLKEFFLNLRAKGRMGKFPWLKEYLGRYGQFSTGNQLRKWMLEWCDNATKDSLPSSIRTGQYWFNQTAVKELILTELVKGYKNNKSQRPYAKCTNLALLAYDVTAPDGRIETFLKGLHTTGYRDLQQRFLRAECLTPIDTKPAHAKSDQPSLFQPDAGL